MTAHTRSSLRSRPLAGVALLAAVCLVVAGCTGPGSADAAQAALGFEQAVGTAPAQACDLLAGHTREEVEKSAKATCAEALPGLDLPDAGSVQNVEVYGHDARVMLEGDVVFLAHFAEGWKVTAAGCEPGDSPDEPFDCEVSGG